MATITWKRKRSSPLVKNVTSSIFDEEHIEESEEFVGDWKTLIPSSKKVMLLEDGNLKSKRLQQEAVLLAGEERYWEAINKFDEAIQFEPNVAKIHEMKAQALLEVGEIFQSIEACEKAVELSPCWAEAYQTLGRAQMGKGEIKMALKNFCKAYHLKPDLDEIVSEDICWAKDLLKKQRDLEKEKKSTDTPDEQIHQSSSCCQCGKGLILEEKATETMKQTNSENIPFD